MSLPKDGVRPRRVRRHISLAPVSVPAASLEEAVAELRSRGLGARDVARAAGVSIETAERAFSGNGHVRRSTRDALLRAAANGNGDR